MIGGLAQLARALDLHSRGHRFDSDILHKEKKSNKKISEVIPKCAIAYVGRYCGAREVH